MDGTGSGSCVMASFGFSSVEPLGSDNSNRDLHYIVIYSNDNGLYLLLPFGNFDSVLV